MNHKSESDHDRPKQCRQRTWGDKFQSTFRGVGLGVRGPRRFESSSARASDTPSQAKSPNSFWVHFPMAALVIVAGVSLNVGLESLALLVVCIGLVIVAELLNTSIEFLASAVTSEYDERVEAALDVASGAVLVASLIAVVVGGIVLGQGVIELLG